METDILIIGGGVIGLSLARELRLKGIEKITILEKNQVCGMEASNAAAGMLAPQAEADKADVFFHFCCESRDLYPNFSDELLSETGVDIELDRSGTLYTAFTDNDLTEINRRYEWQKKAGLDVKSLSAEEARKAEAFISPEVRGALFFPNDWQVENRKLTAALRKYAELNQIEVIENTKAEKLLFDKQKVIGAKLGTGEIFAGKVIVTAGAWSSLIEFGKNISCFFRIKPIRGQMLSYRTAKRLFDKVIYSPRGYLVPRSDGRILVGATVEDVGFDKTVTDGGSQSLRENALEIAPNLVNLKIEENWAGLRPFAPDGLPILGKIPETENLFVAAAHFRNGILLAPLTAQILANEIIEDSHSDYMESFSSRRFTEVSKNSTAGS